MHRPCTWSLLAMVSLAAAFCHAEPPAERSRIAISGQVTDEQSRPVAGVTVRGLAYTDVTQATTDDNGHFVLNVIAERVQQLAIVAEHADSQRLGTYKAPWDDPPTAGSSINIRLAACRSLPVQVNDANGDPAAGVRVGAIIDDAALMSVVTDVAGKATLRLPADAELQSLYAVKQGVGFDYKVVKTPRDGAHQPEWLDEPPIRFQLADSQTVQITLVDADDKPIAGSEVYLWLLQKPGEPDTFNLTSTPTLYRETTDETGVATFRGVPSWDVHSLIFWPGTDQYVRERIVFDPQQHPGGRLTATLHRLVPVTGRVQLADGRPAADVRVSATGVGYKTDGFRQETKTNQQGEFELRVAPDLLYMFAVQDSRWAAAAIDGLIIRPDEPVEGLKFELSPPTRIHGRVTVGPDDKPNAGQRMSLQQLGRDLHNLAGAELSDPEKSRRWVQPSIYRSAVTDEQGRFEFFVGPGEFALSGPSQLKAVKFAVAGEPELAFNFAAARPETGPFAGTVVAGDPPKPVAGAVVEGKYRVFLGRDLRLRADEQGRFSGERSLHRTVLLAKSPDGKMAGIVEIGPDQAQATIQVGPLASARARLIDAETGDPLPQCKVQWGRNVHKGDDDAPWETAWGGTVTTDSAGFFEIAGLVVGQEYSLSFPRGDGTYGGLPSFTPKTADTADLGDLKLEPPYKPPTFAERVDREFASGHPAGERYDHARKEAERLRQHLLVVFLDRDAPLTESWFKLRLDDRPIRSALPDYQLIQVDVKSAGAAGLADRLGIMLAADELPIWQFSDASGKELARGAVPRLPDSGGVDRAALLERLARHAPEPLDARQLLADTLAAAATSNRRVIVQETATWCGPCHMLARYLERHRSIWGKDYLWIRIDQRWHGSEEVMSKIKEGNRGGIPWFAILDGDGKVLATSDGPDGNIGYPGKPESIDHFMAMIQSTMQRISQKELATLRKGLETR